MRYCSSSDTCWGFVLEAYLPCEQDLKKVVESWKHHWLRVQQSSISLGYRKTNKLKKGSILQHLALRNGTQAQKLLGKPREAKRTSTIQRREPDPDPGKNFETLETTWGEQRAVTGVDFVAIEDAGPGEPKNEYPYKKEIWAKNMEPHPEKPGEYRKKTVSRLIEVPEGMIVDCYTIDGEKDKPLPVPAGDFICIGANNEIYPMDKETRAEQFEWVVLK